VLEAIAMASQGHAHAYGDDAWTARAIEAVRHELGAPEAEVAFVFNGTGANVVALSALCRPWESVICPASAHINTDECAAPEHIAGVKLVGVETPDGKLTPALVEPHLTGFGFEHHAQPKVISVSQSTELGTVYSLGEMRELADLAHEHGMLLHVDGARLGNAAASLGVPAFEVITDAGVDALSFGLTKCGAVLAEAVVLLGDAKTDVLPYVRKQSAQLASKMRFSAAQFEAMLTEGLWLGLADSANTMAARLAEGLAAHGIKPAYPVQANEVFAELPTDVIGPLAERFGFYVWAENTAPGRSLVRFVCSWDTESQDVDALTGAIRDALPGEI
jgi:threonine aldolase